MRKNKKDKNTSVITNSGRDLPPWSTVEMQPTSLIVTGRRISCNFLVPSICNKFLDIVTKHYRTKHK